MADKSFGVKELNLLNASGTPTVTSPNNLNLNANTVAISTSCTIGNNLTVTSTTNSANLNVTGIGTLTRGFATDLSVSGISTISQPSNANPHSLWDVVNNGSSAYRFTGPGQSGDENNPNIYLVRGQRYIFKVNASGHPFQLRVANGGAAYSDGVTNNGAQSGNVVINVQHDAPAQLYYQCTSHGGMVGNIYIVGGPQVISGVITATTFSGSGASLTNLPAANLTGTLPAISGANLTSLPAQATIANNADNRVITGGSGVNLNGEANFTYDGDVATITRSANAAGGLSITNTNNSQAHAHARLELSGGDNASAIMRMECNGHANELIADGSGNFRIDDNGTERLRITSAGLVGIATNAPSAAWLDIATNSGSYDHLRMRRLSSDSNVASNWSLKPYGGNLYFRTGGSTDKIYFDDSGDLNIMDGNLIMGTSGHGIDFAATSDASGNTSELFDDYEEGSWTPNIRNTGTTATWSSQQGRYVKIGQQVTVWFNADGGSSPRSGGTSSSLIMTGLPFSQVMFGNPILGSVGANKSSGTGLYSTIGVIFSAFGQGGTQVRFGAGGQPINFGIDYVAGCFTYTAS